MKKNLQISPFTNKKRSVIDDRSESRMENILACRETAIITSLKSFVEFHPDGACFDFHSISTRARRAELFVPLRSIPAVERCSLDRVGRSMYRWIPRGKWKRRVIRAICIPRRSSPSFAPFRHEFGINSSNDESRSTRVSRSLLCCSSTAPGN